jgi:hypothetical protein
VAARASPGASAYSIRHARISELLQLHAADPFTVAHQTGTSLAMVERHICDLFCRRCKRNSRV